MTKQAQSACWWRWLFVSARCLLPIIYHFFCIVWTNREARQPWTSANTDLSQKTDGTKNKDIPRNRELVVEKEGADGWEIKLDDEWLVPAHFLSTNYQIMAKKKLK